MPGAGTARQSGGDTVQPDLAQTTVCCSVVGAWARVCIAWAWTGAWRAADAAKAGWDVGPRIVTTAAARASAAKQNAPARKARSRRFDMSGSLGLSKLHATRRNAACPRRQIGHRLRAAPPRFSVGRNALAADHDIEAARHAVPAVSGLRAAVRGYRMTAELGAGDLAGRPRRAFDRLFLRFRDLLRRLRRRRRQRRGDCHGEGQSQSGGG